MRCYICDYSDNGQQSSYYSGLSGDNTAGKKNGRVKLVDGDYICETCLTSSNHNIRQLKRIHEPNNTDNYRHDIRMLLREFQQDLPQLYSDLDVDGLPIDPDTTHILHEEKVDRR